MCPSLKKTQMSMHHDQAVHDSSILAESKFGRDFATGMQSGLLFGESGYPC